jgi:hypothetical protein
MRRSFFVALVAAIFAVAAGVAYAGNAHFIKNATTVSITSSTQSTTGGALTCSFKEAGLESGSTVTITCNADALVTYECVNGGGKNPSASNKTTTKTHVALTGNFTVDKNGNVVGSLSGGPPSAADLGFSCPSGQTVTYVSVTYSNISISDAQTLASFDFAAGTTLSDTNPSAP